MDPETVAIILSILTACGTLAVGVNQIITNRRNADIQERNTHLEELVAVNQGYGQLVDDLSQRIEGLTKQIKANEAEIADMKRELQESRAENARLRVQIEELEAQNRQLKQELAELRAERC